MTSNRIMKSCIILLLLFIAVSSSAESYTVILKNGKTMKGQLLSETEELLVFKDDQGLQYSLKKSALDLQKMKEANAAPTPPPADSEPVPPPEEIQSPETTVSEPQDSAQQPESQTEPAIQPVVSQTAQPVAGPQIAITESNPYLMSLREGTGKLENTFEEVGSYLDAMMTAWEVNASTGRDPLAALREFKANKGTGLTVSIDALFQVLDKLKTQLNDPPSQYSIAFDAFNASLRDLTEYYNAVRQYDGKPTISVFRSRLGPSEQNIQKKIEELKAVKP